MKKIILPSIFTFIAILLLNFLTPSSASAFFHNKSSLNEFNCQKYWEDLSEGDRLTIGGPTSGNKSDWKFSSNKEALTKASGDSCDIGGIHYDTDSEGEAKNGFEINISYFPNQEEARSKLSSLKAAEPAAVEDKNVSGDTYSMRTVKLDSEERREHFLASGNFGRTVGRVGNCVVSLTHTWYALAYQFNTGDEYDQQVDLMDTIMDGTKRGWQILSEAKDLQRFCGGKAELGKPSTQSPPPSPQKTEETTKQQPSEKKSSKSISKTESGNLPVFISEWFKTVMGTIYFNNWAVDTVAIMVRGQSVEEMKGTERDLKYIENLPEEYVHYATGYRKDHIEDMLEREPQISDDIVKQLKQKVQDSPFRSDILDGQVQIKYPGQHNWADLKQGDKIPPGSTIFTGMDTTTVLSIKDKGVLEILPFTEVTVSEEGLEQAEAEGKTSTEINLRKGEVEVKVEGGVYLPSLQVTTPNGVAGVKGTHFWVGYNDKANATIYGVYKGEVEIKSRGNNKPILVSPNGDKPGVVVITQKLSVIKLTVAGLIVVVVLVGVILFVRKRFALKGRGKKR